MFSDWSDRLAANPPGFHYGVAACDLDGDGTASFVVAGFRGPNRVLKWRGGRLMDVTPPLLADPQRQAVGVAAADVDGDGREELYVLNSDTFSGPKTLPDRLFAHTPAGWADLLADPANRKARSLDAGRSVAALDRRGTGRYSFAVTGYGRPLRLVEADIGGRLHDAAPGLGLDHTTGGRGLWAGPLASDRADLLCVTDHGPNLLFVNDGTGHFVEMADKYGLADRGEHGRGVAVLDADGDGRLDVCWANWHGPNRLLLRQVDGTFRDRATPALALPGAVRTVIAADFDNDGFEELFLNHLGEPNRLFRQTADGWRLADPGPAANPDGLGTGASVADIDGDGNLELLVAHGETAAQPLALYKSPNTNAWLRVRPLTRFGAPARGAVVRLTAGGRTQVWVIDGGSGYLCQMEPVAHFGLGRLDCVESVAVQWPDGARVSVQAPEVRRVLTVPHPDG
jgi:hypothetical protein